MVLALLYFSLKDLGEVVVLLFMYLCTVSLGTIPRRARTSYAEHLCASSTHGRTQYSTAGHMDTFTHATDRHLHVHVCRRTHTLHSRYQCVHTHTHTPQRVPMCTYTHSTTGTHVYGHTYTHMYTHPPQQTPMCTHTLQTGTYMHAHT